MQTFLNYIDDKTIEGYRHLREGELRVADSIQLPDPGLTLAENLAHAKANQVSVVILGVPEDIGPRANHGHPGAVSGWQSTLPHLLRRQANQFFPWHKCLLLGDVELSDLMQESHQAQISRCRHLCAEIDSRLYGVARAVFEQDLELIVIGGGHNNAYPLIRSLSEVQESAVGCCNLDMHCDFREMEGRHSGNGFRYAHEEGYLGFYHVLGLHEQKNNQSSLDALSKAGFDYTTYQQIFIEGSNSFERVLGDISDGMIHANMPMGIELDLDTIKYMPASAYTPAGFSIEQSLHYVFKLAQLPEVKYLHLAEGAVYRDTDQDDIGQVLTELLYSYLSAKHRAGHYE